MGSTCTSHLAAKPASSGDNSMHPKCLLFRDLHHLQPSNIVSCPNALTIRKKKDWHLYGPMVDTLSTNDLGSIETKEDQRSTK